MSPVDKFETIDQLMEEVLNVSMGITASSKTQSVAVTEVSYSCYLYAEKEHEESCIGYEELPPISYDSIKWSPSAKGAELVSSKDQENPNEYECLVHYYLYNARYEKVFSEDAMYGDDLFVVRNSIKKFTSIRIAGYRYDSANKNGEGGYFCAYHTGDKREKVLRPGQIQFFFKHTMKQEVESEDNENDVYVHDFDHYFAFVRWFKFPTTNQQLSQFTHDDTSCWQDAFEDLSQDCILPVHKLHSGVVLKKNYLKSINIATFLPRKFN